MTPRTSWDEGYPPKKQREEDRPTTTEVQVRRYNWVIGVSIVVLVLFVIGVTLATH